MCASRSPCGSSDDSAQQLPKLRTPGLPVVCVTPYPHAAIGRAMSRLWQSALQRAGALLIVALIFVPLVVSGHSHQAGQRRATDACALCVATHHSPAVSSPPVPELAPLLAGFAPVAPYAALPFRLNPAFKPGRAPPARFASRVA